MVKIKVPDMACGHCEKRIKEVLAKLDISCEVILAEKVVLVEESKLDIAFNEIYDIGFTPEK
ncbi:MAG: heavy-metal-associated domain-containing protein [Clostridia bacterium]|nr:heavy-metal-associated domain-containing protein [Clostridia bacterium]